MVTINMRRGHYANVCSVNRHSTLGMQQDFWIRPKSSTPIFVFQAEDGIRDRPVTVVQTCALPISVSFLITNDGTVDHEMVVLKTDKPADSFPITGFEG